MTRNRPDSQKKPSASRKRATQPPGQEIAELAPSLFIEPPIVDPGRPLGADPSATASVTAAVPPAEDASHPLAVELSETASIPIPLSPAEPESHSDPIILIEIDPVVSGGYVHNRLDVMIRGRAVSAAPIQEIKLEVGGLVASSAFYGQPERAATAVMPDGTPARQRAFHFNLPRPGDGEPERCVFQVIARTDNGSQRVEYFEVELDAAAMEPIAIVSGPTRPGVASGRTRPHTVMYIERATIDGDGILSVQGWAVSLGSIQGVRIFADDKRISEARMGAERADVANVFPAYPNARLSGFNLTLPLDEADRDAEIIRAELICPNGFGHQEAIPVERLRRRDTPPDPPAVIVAAPRPAMETQSFLLFNQQPAYQLKAEFRIADDQLFGLIQSPPLQPPNPATVPAEPAEVLAPPPEEVSSEIEMYCDAATLTGDGTLSINGWAVCAAGVAQVRVLLNDKEVGLASSGYERKDVAGIFPNIAMAQYSGFRFKQHIADSFHGQHNVRVVVRNLRNDEKEKQVSVIATEVSQPSPTVVVSQIKRAPEMTPEQTAEFKFELDAPALCDGVAVETVTGRLTIDGWLLTRTGVASFEVFLDDLCLGDVHYGLARQDVGTAFPDVPNALRSGYAFHCPPRSLRDGEHTVRLKIRANSGQELVHSFDITVKKADDQQESAGIRRRVPRVEADLMSGFLADMDYRPSFQIILRQDGPIDAGRLRTTFNALGSQSYRDWTVIVLAGDDDIATAVQGVIGELEQQLAERFSIATPSDTEAWTAPLACAHEGRRTLYTLLLPGDELGADAMLELAVACGRDLDRELVYADEVRVSPVSNEREPFFKPDFSPDLLYSTNYIGRPWIATAGLLARTGATPENLMANGEYDLVLRCAELANSVHHVPKLLCQRAPLVLDDPVQECAALGSMLDRRGIAAEVLSTPIQGTWRVKRTVASKAKVSIIIPTCAAHGYIETCITTLRARTAYPNFEIICIDNIRPSEIAWKIWLHQKSDKVVEIPDAFNWSSFNNRAAEVADGEFLLFLNDDIEIIQDDWLDRLMEHAQRPEVGITGPQLLYRDGKVQHAGMFLSDNGIGRHAFRFAAKDDPCYFGLALTQRNVIAVTGACMLVRKKTFERLGRFDEAHEIVNNDLDFCLKVHRAGLLTVFTPYASLVHYELASRAGLRDVFDLRHFNAAWKTTFAAGDPYFNPRLSSHADDYRPDDEPVQWVVSGAPMFHAEEIERILVVKLDHIGDFVTALPPIRRLRKLFPHAHITVLAGPASRAFIALESSIDEFIPFSFFHARSQLGERQLTAEDYAALAKQLRPLRFDLAVDLRKHISTRDVLRYTGARFLAGFDYLGQFPFLDIALDWDGDRTLQRKRSHIVDDLLRLVNAIGHATETDRVLIQPGPAALPLTELPAEVQALFEKPVVAIHPGAGNVTKQWPERHFSALIDMLIENNGVNIMLVGGPEDVAVADSLIENMLRPHAVASMAGRTSLADLPRLLKNCVLYIGNDSGPKHIAAAVGIPTVGIHSGVVDPVEWGPLGPSAVALRRNMTCSPCYLASAEDCPRSLACLRFLMPNMVYETANLMLPRSGPVIEAPAASEPAAGDDHLYGPPVALPEPVTEATSEPQLAATEPV